MRGVEPDPDDALRHWPLAGLVLRTPRLELRPDDDAGLAALADRALDGVGIIDRRWGSARDARQPGGAIVHWHVDDLPGTVARLLALGASEYQPVTEHGDGAGFTTASVVDPFGNVLGVMHNPHFLAVAAAREAVAAPV